MIKNHGDRCCPLRIGLWDLCQNGRFFMGVDPITTYVRHGMILQKLTWNLNMDPRKGRFLKRTPPFSGQPAVGGYTVHAIKKQSADLRGTLVGFFWIGFSKNLSHEKKGPLVGPGLYRGWNTTQWYKDYNKPLTIPINQPGFDGK